MSRQLANTRNAGKSTEFTRQPTLGSSKLTQKPKVSSPFQSSQQKPDYKFSFTSASKQTTSFDNESKKDHYNEANERQIEKLSQKAVQVISDEEMTRHLETSTYLNIGEGLVSVFDEPKTQINKSLEVLKSMLVAEQTCRKQLMQRHLSVIEAMKLSDLNADSEIVKQAVNQFFERNIVRPPNETEVWMSWLNWNNTPDPLLASTSNQQQIINLVSEQAELEDPTPNLHEMFQIYDIQFFDGKLGRCTVEWSKRMTTCAGICYYKPAEGLCIIRMSEKLLKLRPRSDFVETLLHEMIHAYLFVTERFADRDGHGENFQAHMRRINRMANTNITIYHSFHAEVAVYKQHVWRCDGECQQRAPYFGFVKRAMNRAPSKNDFWWATHQATCGGTFHKIKEPEKTKTKKSQPQLKEITSAVNNVKAPTIKKPQDKKAQPKLEDFFPTTNATMSPISSKSETLAGSSPVDQFVECPSCTGLISMLQLNDHLDTCLS